jgi:hypothetical protein
MTTLAQLFGTSTAFTLNATTWAQAVTISSSAVDISGIATVPDDILITVNATFGVSIAAQKAVNIYISCSEDGTNFDDNDQYSGTNNSQAGLRSPTNFKGPIVLNGTSSIATAITFSLLAATGLRVLPRKFGIVLENQSNVTISTKSASYTPVNYTNA